MLVYNPEVMEFRVIIHSILQKFTGSGKTLNFDPTSKSEIFANRKVSAYFFIFCYSWGKDTKICFPPDLSNGFISTK